VSEKKSELKWEKIGNWRKKRDIKTKIWEGLKAPKIGLLELKGPKKY
jgi:hypothetical protein